MSTSNLCNEGGAIAVADVEYEKHDGWAEIRFNRPDHHNAMTVSMLDGLLRATEDATGDPVVRVLRLSGAGRSFCVGGDLDAFSTGALHEPVPVATQAGDLRRHMRVVQLLRDSDTVSVAAINGACAGAGLSIAAACDIRIASRRAVFRTAFLDAGLSGDFGGSWLLSKLIGEARARSMYLLNPKLTANEAMEFGLVARVFDEGDFAAGATSVVTELASKAPQALAAMKLNLAQVGDDFSSACDREAWRHTSTGRTNDAVEAAQAFLQKRAPQFTGN
jgi:2-(1,2-epoxy-1,2-dihydrophenyl)acetyl-CoA isomerase